MTASEVDQVGVLPERSPKDWIHRGLMTLPFALQRPLVLLDLETTGVSTATAEVVELAMVRLGPSDVNGQVLREEWVGRFRAVSGIPAEAALIHGITNDMVADCPTLSERIQWVWQTLQGVDLAGYNLKTYDLPILARYASQQGLSKLPGSGQRVYDALQVFRKHQRQRLEDAVRFYCKREHSDAHGALSDTQATLDVMIGQFQLHKEALPMDILAVDGDASTGASDGEQCLDPDGRVRMQDGYPVLTFSKHKGIPLRKAYQQDPGFFHWLLKNPGFASTTKEVVCKALGIGVINRQGA